MRKIIPFTLTLLLLPLLLSCGHGGYRATLNHIDTLLRTDPSTALAITDSLLQYESNMSRAEQMRTRLYRGVARIRTYNPVTDDSTATAIARYYDSHGTPNDRMMAYYLLGCTNRDLGDTPMQLECLQKAAESADTTRNDCDYYTMVSIYGHLANLYHKQVLPEEELSVLKKLGESAKKDNDTITEIMAYKLQMGSCYLLKDTDRIFLISDTAQILYKQNGYNELAARVLVTPISISIDRGDYSKAKELLRIFENESGLFDTDGNIEKGWEYFYYNKGRYLLGTGKPDSAIIFFRKASGCCIDESIYKGLFNAYIRKHEPDSIAKYGQLFVNANDSAWLAKNSQTVAQMTAMYDYSRHKKQAEENAVRAEHAERIRTRLFSLLLAVILASAYIYNKVRKRSKEKISHISQLYQKTNLLLADTSSELNRLKEEFQRRTDEDTTALNEYKQENADAMDEIQRLNSAIDNYRKQMERTIEDRMEKEFFTTDCYERFRKMSDSSEKTKPGRKDWNTLTSLFCQHFPKHHTYLTASNLRDMQYRYAMLARMGFDDVQIMTLTDKSKQQINKTKQQVNRKLFGQDTAKNLRQNLKQLY